MFLLTKHHLTALARHHATGDRYDSHQKTLDAVARCLGFANLHQCREIINDTTLPKRWDEILAQPVTQSACHLLNAYGIEDQDHDFGPDPLKTPLPLYRICIHYLTLFARSTETNRW